MPPPPQQPTYTAPDEANRFVTVGGEIAYPVPVLESWPAWQGMQLHQLARPAEYQCLHCRTRCESTMAATINHDRRALLCHNCYHLHRRGNR